MTCKTLIVLAVVSLVCAMFSPAWAAEQPSSPSDRKDVPVPIKDEADDPAEAEDVVPVESEEPQGERSSRQGLIASLTIFVLAVFVGFEVITKVPTTLHTPLMSGSNAISGITLVGAVIVTAGFSVSSFVGFLAVILATINVVGGFLVTHRMFEMFQRK